MSVRADLLSPEREAALRLDNVSRLSASLLCEQTMSPSW